MRIFVLCMLALCFCTVANGQYRIVYDSTALPEIYNRVPIAVQQLAGNKYQNLSDRKYTLNAKYGSVQQGMYSFSYQDLYQHNGQAEFLLQANGREVPLTFQFPVLQRIRFNLYTDSIKPVLNYYVNVEGIFTNGKILPLDSSMVMVTSDVSKVAGMEWIVPRELNFDKVHFTATSRYNPKLRISTTVYIKRTKDARDAPEYDDGKDMRKR